MWLLPIIIIRPIICGKLFLHSISPYTEEWNEFETDYGDATDEGVYV